MVKRHKCAFEGCNKVFPYPSFLTRHIRTHTGEKPYKCTECGQTFARKHHLDSHMRRHTGEKPFECTECDKAFAQSGKIITHMRTHTGEKPYKCTECDKAFAQSGARTTHMRTHTGEKPFKCTECDKAFAHKCTLKSHIFIHHTREGQARKKIEEQRIFRALTKAGIDFKREHRIDFSCFKSDSTTAWAQIDFLIILAGVIIMLEVDEEQHRFYKGGISCDMKRMGHIMAGVRLGGNSMPVLFIRYNPHSFKINYEKQKGLPKKEREQILIQFIKDYKSPGEGLDIAYMYYDYETDGDDVNLVVTNSNEYHPQMKECVRHIIR